MKLRWVSSVNEVKLQGYCQCFDNFIITLKLITAFNNTTYKQWLRIILMYNQGTIHQYPPWQQIHEVTDAPSTVIYIWRFHRQKLITTDHLLTSKWATTRQVTFHAGIWFHKRDTWLTHACVHGHSAWTSEESGQYHRDDVASVKQNSPIKIHKAINMSSILMPAEQPGFISGG